MGKLSVDHTDSGDRPGVESHSGEYPIDEMITTTDTLLKDLVPISDEISTVTPLSFRNYQAGLVLFQPRQRKDEKWITHTDADVIGYVLKGQGRLRLQEKESQVSPGVLCHISANTPHDFLAEGDEPLLMFYVTIKVNSEAD